MESGSSIGRRVKLLRTMKVDLHFLRASKHFYDRQLKREIENLNLQTNLVQRKNNG